MPGQFKTAVISLSLLLALAFGPRASLEAQTAAPEAAALPASGAAGPAAKAYTGEKISLEFQKATIPNILQTISEAAGKKIVVSDDVRSNALITLKLNNCPWDQALDIVLANCWLNMEESGDVITVYDPKNRLAAEKAAKRAAAMALPPLAKNVFTPKHAPIGQVAAGLNKLKSERGKMVSIGNDIYVEDEPEAMAAMSKAFIELDRVARRILIEARIVEADAAFIESLNTNWKDGDAESARPMKEAEEKVKPATLAYDFLSKKNSLYLNASITASETTGGARTISAPRIIAANDQEVNIRQGRHIGCGTRMSSSSTNPYTQYKPPAMEFLITPHIADENDQLVALSLKIVNEEPKTGEPEEAYTELMVKDGETLVIGGLIMEGGQGPESRLAGGREMSLSDWLHSDHPNKNTELLIFLTATIIPINI